MADISNIKLKGISYTIKSKNDHLHNNRDVLDNIINKSDDKTYGIKNGNLTEVEVTSNDVLYTNSTPIPSTLGGISKGSTFNNVSIKKILEDLLYPYIKPVILSSANNVYKEKGNTDSDVQKTINVNIKKGSASITNLTIRVKTGDTINTYPSDTLISSINSVSSGDNVTINFPYSLTTNGEDTTYVYLDVKDEKTQVVSSTIQSFSFIYPIYYGNVSNENEVTEAKIKQLAASVTPKANKVLSYTGENIIPIYAYPNSYGSLSSIVDKNGFDVTDVFKIKTLNITNEYNKTTNYNVYYLSNTTTLSNFTFTFKF